MVQKKNHAEILGRHLTDYSFEPNNLISHSSGRIKLNWKISICEQGIYKYLGENFQERRWPMAPSYPAYVGCGCKRRGRPTTRTGSNTPEDGGNTGDEVGGCPRMAVVCHWLP
jgi:hypothetical protein